MSTISGQSHEATQYVIRGQGFDAFTRRLSRAVVHEYYLDGEFRVLKHTPELEVDSRDVILFIVSR
jgi:hypothetical protein